MVKPTDDRTRQSTAAGLRLSTEDPHQTGVMWTWRSCCRPGRKVIVDRRNDISSLWLLMVVVDNELEDWKMKEGVVDHLSELGYPASRRRVDAGQGKPK
jgi:hypothetical protein